MVTTEVWIALGTNLGERECLLIEAAERITNAVSIAARSRLYDTEPWGFADQPRFLNAVVRGTTALKPLDLLAFLKGIEQEMGREPTFRYGPRVIDLDILIYGNWVLYSDILKIPHHRMAERLFVLQPLCDVSPEWRHPHTGLTTEAMRDSLLRTTAESVRPYEKTPADWYLS